jgi:hypothetical protein
VCALSVGVDAVGTLSWLVLWELKCYKEENFNNWLELWKERLQQHVG